MLKQLLFILVLSLVAVSFGAHAQVEEYPLSQYSVGQEYHHSKSNLKFASKPQTDTLTIPFIEDFSGAMVPIKEITVDTAQLPTDDSIYQIKHLKMHGLDPNGSTAIFIFNVTFPNAPNTINIKNDSLNIYGKKFARVIDKYTIKIYNDTALTIPAPIRVDPKAGVFSGNWLRYPVPRYSTYPDTLSFLDNDGGVFINDDMAPNAPSVGVASFDGVNYKGIPYSTTPINGYADNLTSLPFHLKQYTKTDKVGLSFYWQSSSLGDSPLSKEYLYVEFKDSKNNWNQVLKLSGDPADKRDTFRLAFIPIDSMYLYDGFQFRIRNYGILNGRFNVWNVDYIYINTNMTLATATTQDVSLSSINKNCLLNYTSIPYKHFKSLSNPQSQLKPKSAIRIRNQQPGITVYKFSMTTTDNRLDTLNTLVLDAAPTTLFVDTSFATTVDPSRMHKPYILRQNFYFNNVDVAAPIDMSFNNFRRNETTFYDYYAYDDGTPEISLKSQQAGGTRLVNKITTLQKDTLTHLDFCFIKNNGPDLSNLTLFMTVWRSNSTEVVKDGQAIAIKYSTDINGFVRYEFFPHIVLEAGTYYFGFRQEFNYPLFVGYDRNNDQLNKVFTSVDGLTWVPVSSAGVRPGALMIRPVFSKSETIVTSVKTTDLPEQKEQFTIYPNPTAQNITISGAPDYVILYDLQGRMLFQSALDVEKNSIQLDNLPNGIYVVAIKKNDYTEIKRLVVQK